MEIRIRNDSYSVYKHETPNGKVYIGITKQRPIKRWQNGGGYDKQPLFYRAIKKYGWSNISHEILFEGLSKEQAEAKEIELIQHYRSNDKNYGYNISNGGATLGTVSEETKEKIRQANLGNHRGEETRAKISKALKGRKHTEEEKRKITQGLMGHGCKKVINLDTGETYKSLREVAKALGISNSGHVIQVCKGQRKTAYGFHWAYVEEVS